MIRASRNKEFRQGRIIVLIVGFFLFGLILIWRLFVLQILNQNLYEKLASEKQGFEKNLFPKRGIIYVKERNEAGQEVIFPLVTNKEYNLIYAVPKEINNTKEVIDKIVPILGLKEDEWQEVLARINKKDDPYEPIKHKATIDEVEAVKKLNLAGIYFVPETFRYYADKSFGGHVLGFVSQAEDRKFGQYGIEGYFEKELSGKPGLLKATKDALGSLITIGERSIKKAEDGQSIVLTIDRVIQAKVCQRLKEVADWFKAEQGTIIIMQPKTGAIIAMCSVPDFDPENYNEVEDINHFNNPATFYPYEPGSVFKPITMAIGLELGKVTPETTYIDEGKIKIGPFTVRNADLKTHGEQTMTQVLEKSLNTGAIFVADKIGKRDFKKYVKDFGFGELTGITLDTEMPGDISSLDRRGEIYTLTASYGQGITVTPLQLITAFAAIANDGKLVKPYIVDEIIKPSGETTKTQTQEIRQVITPSTARILQGMMVSVVKNGYGKKAAIENYLVAGKTGTAQVADPGGGYGSKTIHTFVGFTPVDDPAFVMLIKLNNPQGVRFASDTVTPIFSEIGQFVLNYYQIPPSY